MTSLQRRILAGFAVLGVLTASTVSTAQQMQNLKEMSGIPRPVEDLPAGTVSVRVIRGDFSKNVPDQPVEFVVAGKSQTVRTDAEGRAQIAGLRPGTAVRANTTLDGEKLESQVITIGTSGIRVMLVGTDPTQAARATEDERLAAAPPVKGTVALGPESRVVVQFQDERLELFYVIEIVNSARTRVDIGGPLALDLPREARGASLLEASSKQATVTGGRLTITGPFAPGSTTVQVAYELPFDGAVAHISQRWPAALPQLTVLMPRTGSLDLRSSQLTSKREVNDQGQQVLLGSGPGLAAGQAFELDVTGLPHRQHWPRYLALGLAGAIISVGVWAAVFVPSRRRIA